eukprot:CAMPEP_0177156340 /NCGR_PEP_ID=MMETSP0367-20130122/2676_1 /TAXON_ID=447022 ORGANISM="Scrippsiella hangoei-like, Strain SHHI-4" /NCGR_SAMPLE_ID=MMETSP0367 /ASSEMBLY_ACC=CAM_ASM_000362 /LENGTH=169 /DNA_ID=CAMNT_0018601791 /DNA_START=46 /DNA_END=555 /DNA_ORIENTATION=-
MGDASLQPAEDHVRGLLQWLREDEFITTIAEWSWDWCLEFPKEPVAVSSVEHALSCTEAHREYREMFEARAQEYLRVHGLAEENFLQLAVEFCSRANDFPDVFDGLVASESYATFFRYMVMVRGRREFAERTMCSSSDEIDWVELVRRSLRRDLGDVTVGDDLNSQFID